jgi:stage II sporulation protein P
MKRSGLLAASLRLLLLLLVMLLTAWTSAAWAMSQTLPASSENRTSDDTVKESTDDTGMLEEWWERREGGYYTVRVDSSGKLLTYTTLELQPGDIYVASDNTTYEVKRGVGDDIFVEEKGKAKLPDIDDELMERLREELKAEVSRPLTRESPLVGIYFTHSDESYRPSSGMTSETPRGDVYRVGEALGDGLRRQGVRVDVREETHVPHDGLAYHRSRATVRKLLTQMPALLIDIHRDAVPPDIYTTNVGGKTATRVRIVVGRQNPQRESNFDFAKRLKAVADRLFPDLVLDIFFGYGNYNQDVGPRSVLLEFGTADNSLDQAMVAAELFSKVIPAAAGLGPNVTRPDTAVGLRYIWIALALLAVVGGGFLFFYRINRLPGRQ